MQERRPFLALPDSRLAQLGAALVFMLAALFGAAAVITGGVPLVFFQSVATPSMEPAILCAKSSNDSCTATQKASLFIIDYLTFHFRSPRRGDIVVFTPSPHARWLCGDERDRAKWIKRVVGLPGETVAERNASLYVDGHAVSQPYLSRGERLDLWGPYRVPEGSYFLLGDNRFAACDSRTIGAVPRSQIKGLVRMIWRRPPSFLPS